MSKERAALPCPWRWTKRARSYPGRCAASSCRASRYVGVEQRGQQLRLDRDDLRSGEHLQPPRTLQRHGALQTDGPRTRREHIDTVGQEQRLVEVVGDEQARRAEPLPEVGKPSLQA